MKITKRVAALVLAAVAGGALYGATLGSGPAGATDSATEKTVTKNMVRPDSAPGGYNWATDTFKRVVVVTVTPDLTAKTTVPVDGAIYTVKGTDTGTFKTTGVKSFANHTMVPGVTGDLTGKWTAKCVAPAPDENGAWPHFVTGGTDADSTSEWVGKLWSQGAKCELTSWGWDYTTCNEKLTNASAGNHGDITGLSTQDLKKCLTATVKVLCGNKADVTVTNNFSVTVKVTINGKVYEVAPGTHTISAVLADSDHEIKVLFGRDWLAKVKCIKPTTCPTPTGSATPTPTATVTTPPPPTTAPASSSAAPVPVQNVGGTGRLALTGSSTPLIAGGGVLLVIVGAGLLLLVARNHRRSQLVPVSDENPNDTITFHPQH